MEFIEKKYKKSILFRTLSFVSGISTILTASLLLAFIFLEYYVFHTKFFIVALFSFLLFFNVMAIIVISYFMQKERYSHIYIIFKLYVLESKEYREKYQKIGLWKYWILTWDQELASYNNNVELWFKDWYEKKEW